MFSIENNFYFFIEYGSCKKYAAIFTNYYAKVRVQYNRNNDGFTYI